MRLYLKKAGKEALGDCIVVLAGTLDKKVGENSLGIEDLKIGAECKFPLTCAHGRFQ